MSQTKITGISKATVEQMTAYIRKINPNVAKTVIDMIPYYISEGKTEGIRGDIAFAQSCLETGNFTFTGSAVTLDQNNFCGMGVTQRGMRGNSFKTAQYGIRAQIQHLKAYANNEPLIGKCIDTRFTYVKRGCAPYVEWLGMKENPNGYGWAAGANYGSKILTILNNILGIKTEQPTNPQEVDKMKFFICVGHSEYANGVISSANGLVNEFRYNEKLAPYVVEWLKKAGHEADLCIAPKGKCNSLNDEINYFIGLEQKKDYDVSVQLHLNAFNGGAYGCEAYAYSDKGLEIAKRICSKLGTIWENRGAQIRKGLYWTKRTKNTAVLVESFFCDNYYDYQKAKALGYSEHAKLIAEALINKSILSTTQEIQDNSPIKYRVQCGAFKTREAADNMMNKLKKAGFDCILKEE